MTAFWHSSALEETHQVNFDTHVNSANATEKLLKKFILGMLERKLVELDNIAG
jgi:hypothetical protein